MTLSKLLHELDQHQIKLYLCEGRLNYRAPAGMFSEELRDLVHRYKTQLIDRLEKYSDSNTRIKKISKKQQVNLCIEQKVLWQFCQNEKNHRNCNRAVAFRLQGDLQIAIFKQALAFLWQRHPVIRTRFHYKKDKLVQSVIDDLPLPYEFLDNTRKTFSGEQLNELLKCKAAIPFDFNVGSLASFYLIKVNDCEYLFLFVVHQLATDGQSITLMINELSMLYQRLLSGEKTDLASEPFTYLDYVYWKERYFSQNRSRLQNFWYSQLENMSNITDDLADCPSMEGSKGEMAIVEFSLNNNLITVLLDYAKRKRVTAFGFFLAVFFILLRKKSKSNDVLVVSPFSLRDQAEFANVSGYFVNNLLLRNIVDDKQFFSCFLNGVVNNIMKAEQYKHLPYESLIKQIKLEQGVELNPVGFSFQTLSMNAITFSDLNVSGLDKKPMQSRFDLIQWNEKSNNDLNFLFELTNENCIGRVYYNMARFDVNTIKSMVGDYMKLLEYIPFSSDRVLGDFVNQ